MNRKNYAKKKDWIDMDYELWKATKEYFRNKRKVLAGETYRSQKRTGPKKAPSHYRARY